MKDLENLNQLTMCALGKCHVCVYNDEGGCRDRIDKISRELAASLLQKQSDKK